VQLSQRQTGRIRKEENLLNTIVVVEEETNRMPKKKSRKCTKEEVQVCVSLNEVADESSDDGGQ
jgi:hypothetical protein